MKKTFLACLVASFLVATMIAIPAYAASFQTGESISVTNPITDDLYMAGQTIVISQDITGDLYVTGMSVQINANVSGDLVAVAQTITLNGNVGDDAKLVAQDIYLNGNVGDDLMTGSSGLNISVISTIGGTLYAFANTANINGVIAGDLEMMSDAVSFTAQVNGDAHINSGSALSIGDSAKINGTLMYSSPEESEIPAGVVVGEVTYTSNFVPEMPKKDETGLRDIANGFASQAFKFLGLLFIGFVLLLAMPFSFKTVAVMTKESYLKALWYGLVFVIAIPVISFLLLFTIIGIKFAGIMMVLWLIVWPFGKIYGSYFIMSLIFKPAKKEQFWRELGVLALGLFALVVIHMLPFVGWIAWWGVTFVGIGGLILYKLKIYELVKGKL